MACAAFSMFMQTAPLDSVCSHSGILCSGVTREVTATTMGARWKRSRSTSTSSSNASGFSVLNASARTSPNAARDSPLMTTKRHGPSLPWSGTRMPVLRIVSSSASLGPGSPRLRAVTERRVIRKSMMSVMVCSGESR